MSLSSRRQLLSHERKLIARLRTPEAVQQFLNRLPYNQEVGGETLRSFRQVVRTHTAHCLEAALFAAVVLEQHGHPPLVLSFESRDHLDHVIFVYRSGVCWGSVARSRDPGLHARQPVFRRPRDLALSYVEPYVDYTGEITAYAVVNLDDELNGYDWRFSKRNVWKVEQMLIDFPHRPIRSSSVRIDRLRQRYVAFRDAHDGAKPVSIYGRRDRWSAIPAEYLAKGER
jgi:hypothetical protein